MSEETTQNAAQEQGVATQPPVQPVSEPQAEPAPAEPKKILFSKDVKLPSTGELVTVKKLKAGKYYEAQQLYVRWLHTLEEFMKSQKISPDKMLGEDGKPDITRIRTHLDEVSQATLEATTRLAQDASEQRTLLLAFCLEMSTDQLNDKFYPEDLAVLWEAVDELNDFMTNLKKSVAPTSVLGA